YALRVQFPFIFVDEFQDTNPLQARIIEHLGSGSTIVGTIGDIAQSIYSFQGARPSEFKNFNIHGHTDTYGYEISGNRRSENNIVQLCNYIRNSDALKQISISTSLKSKEKDKNKVVFLVGDTDYNSKLINGIVGEGGVVL